MMFSKRTVHSGNIIQKERTKDKENEPISLPNPVNVCVFLSEFANANVYGAFTVQGQRGSENANVHGLESENANVLLPKN